MNSPEVKAGIGGWLLLPALGLVLTPLRMSYGIYKDLWPVFSEGYWEVLTTPTSEAYHPYWAALIIFEMAGNAVLIAITLVALYFFFSKSRHTPRVMVVWLGAILAFTATDFFVADLIPAVAEQKDDQSVKELGRAVVGAAIWIPYFLVSKRVKATFVK